MCAAAYSATGRVSTISGAGGEFAFDLLDVERRQIGQFVVSTGAAPVDLGEPQEVAGERPEPGEQRLDERVLVVDPEQRVGRPLAPERRRETGGARHRAERSGAVGGIDGQAVGQVLEPAQRVEHVVSQRLGEVGTVQIGAADGADHQRPTREQGDVDAVPLEHVDVMVAGVARRRGHPQ